MMCCGCACFRPAEWESHLRKILKGGAELAQVGEITAQTNLGTEFGHARGVTSVDQEHGHGNHVLELTLRSWLSSLNDS